MFDLTLEASAHLIQTALTPVFLLSGIAALLNVYAGRLARVADRIDLLTALQRDGSTQGAPVNDEIARLTRRLHVLDISVVFGTVGAAATCLAILTLFLLGLSNKAIAGLLIVFFGIAIVCSLVSVTLFGIEMLISSSGMRAHLHLHWPSLAARHGAETPRG